MRPFTILCSFCSLLVPTISQGAVVSIGDYTAGPGDTISIPVVVDDPGSIAGAAFSIHYDSSIFALEAVESDFFDVFSNQWNSLVPLPDPMPPSQVMVDGTLYDQPIYAYTGIDQAMLVGVRVQTGSLNATLFTLTFSITGDAPAGEYSLELAPTSLENDAMGYTTGDTVTPLVGIGAGDSYPAVSCSFESGTVSIKISFIDSDNDGIDDNWEYDYYPADLNRFGTNSDYDFDGYTDLQEYLNFMDSPDGLDENGQEWSPLLQNAPGQTGYSMNEEEFWLQLLPAIQQGAKSN